MKNKNDWRGETYDPFGVLDNPPRTPICDCESGTHSCPHCGWYIDTLSTTKRLDHKDACHKRETQSSSPLGRIYDTN